MNHNRKEGQLAGLFLLAMVAMGIPGVMFRGISSTMLEDPNLLSNLLDGTLEMRLSILLSFLAGIFGLLFSVKAYQVLRPHSQFAAVFYLALWIFQAAIATIGDVSHYILLESAQLANSKNLDLASFTQIGAIGVKGYVGAHFLSLIIFSGSFVFLHANFLKYGLLPKWLSIWGMLATGTVFTVTWLQIFDQSVSFHFYNQNGLFMLTFTAYMLIKGFRESRDV